MTKNNLNTLLMNMSRKFDNVEYKQATSTLYQLLNSVTFGYDNSLSPQFLNDSQDIYSKYGLAKALNKTTKKINTYKMVKYGEKNNIINFMNFKKK